MLPFGVTIPATVPQGSEIPEGFMNNPVDALISQIYFGIKIYMFLTVPLSINRSLLTVHSAVVYVIQVCNSSRFFIIKPNR